MTTLTKDSGSGSGWNCAATSSGALVGDGRLTFGVLAPSVGIFVGLNDTGVGLEYLRVQYGLYLSQGKVAVYERGAVKTALSVYTSGAIFSIQRRGSVVSYYRDSTLLYTSMIPSAGALVACTAIYDASSTIIDPAFTSVVQGTNSSAGSTAALAGYAFVGDRAESAVSFPLLATSITARTNLDVTSILPALRSLGGINAAQSAIVLPSMQSAASTDNIPSGDFTSHATLASVMTAAADGRTSSIGHAAVSTPSAFITATGTELEPNAFSGVMPFSFAAYGAGNAVLAMASPSLSIAATIGTTGHAALTMPSATLAASGMAGSVGTADLTYRTKATVQAYSGAVLSVNLFGSSAGAISATGTAGALGAAELTLPLYSLVSSGTVHGLSSAALTMPMIRPTPSGLAFVLAPSARLVAIGTAIVAVTTEAYAMQMLIDPDDKAPVQAVSHYTSYPFTQIIRHNNIYYGVAMDGLYQLGGDTDDGAAIPWAIKTGLDDFKNKQLKRISSLYVNGRIATGVTVDVVVGEAEEDVYTYTTVRGRNAQNHNVPVGKGLRSRYYGLGIRDAAGRNSEIDGIELDIDILKRAI